MQQQDPVLSVSGYKEFKTCKKKYNIDFDIQWPLEMPEETLNCILDFVEDNTRVSEISEAFCRSLREKLDIKFGPCWNVFIGKSFGADAIHDKYNFVYFKYKSYYYLVYKTTV